MEVKVLPRRQLAVEGVLLGDHADHLLGQGGVGHHIDATDERLPAEGITLVVSTPTVVVFPAPLGPSSPKTSPMPTRRLSPSTARKSVPGRS